MPSFRTVTLFRKLAQLWEPRPPLTVSQWADRYRFLTTATSAEPGPWRTDRAAYLREMMDAINDPQTQEVAIMASAQVAKTETLLNFVGYHIDQDPAPIMYMLPTDKLVESFSKKRLATMIEASPQLHNKVSAAKGRDSSNTISEKSFPGGYIAIVGANSPSDLSSRPIRILLCDEVDRYPVSAGDEGDPINLAKKRTTTFYNRKHIFVSTPVNKDASRIEQLYEDSTKEEFSFPCPSCDELQPIKWRQIKFSYTKTKDDEYIVDAVHHACKGCGSMHEEKEWKRGKGRWVAQKKHRSRRGFHLSQLISPWSTWEEIVIEFLVAKKEGPKKLKVWTNTVLGEPWEEEKGKQFDAEILLNRREIYHADVPDGVKVLTAAVDTQDDRFEVEVQGWGSGHENWRIQYHVIYGDLKQSQVWADLDGFLQRVWKDQQGREFPISITCMDSGGHFTGEVYNFCKQRFSRRVFAIRGESSGDGTYLPLIIGTTNKNRYRATVVRLGVNEGKSKVMSAVSLPPVDENGEKVKGYCHFPLTTPERNRGYDRQYFDGLTAEVSQTRYRMGVPYQVWVQVRDRNEPLDLAVYNRAAIEILQPNLDAPLPDMQQEINKPVVRKRRKNRGVASSV